MPHINHRRGETRQSVNRETRCSCYMCGNPRKWWKQRTRHEELAELSTHEQLKDWPAKHWPRSKRGEKPYIIQRSSLWARGGLLHGFHNFRRYRTREVAEAALASLRDSVRLNRRGVPIEEYQLVLPEDYA